MSFKKLKQIQQKLKPEGNQICEGFLLKTALI